MNDLPGLERAFFHPETTSTLSDRGRDMPAMNDDQISEVYKGEIWTDDAQERTRRRIHWMISQVRGSQVIDIGCSQGITSILLGRQGFEVVGVDIQDSRIEYAQADLVQEEEETRKRVHFLLSNGEQLPFADESFDTVLLGEIIEHLEDPSPLLAEATRVLRSGGITVLTTPFGFLHHPDHKRAFYTDDLCTLISKYLGIVSAEIRDRYFRIVGQKAAETDPMILDSLKRQAENVVFDIQQELDGLRRKVGRLTSDLDKAAKSAASQQQRVTQFQQRLSRTEVAWRETKERLQEKERQYRSLSAELRKVMEAAQAATRNSDELAWTRRTLERRERRIARLQYRIEVSNWKLASIRQRRWWRIGTELGEVRRRPLSLFALPVRLLRVLRTKAPTTPRPTPPAEIASKADMPFSELNKGEVSYLQGPIIPRHDVAALGLLGPELWRQISHEVHVFDLDLDNWRDQITDLAPQLLLVESGFNVSSATLSEVLETATALGIRTVLWDSETSALTNEFRKRFDVIVGDEELDDDELAGRLVRRRGLVQPRIQNPIGSRRVHESADVELAEREIADTEVSTSTGLATTAKKYRVLRASGPALFADIAPLAATATPLLVRGHSDHLGIPTETDEEAEAMERSLLRSEVLRARLTHPQMRGVIREFSISSDVNELLNGNASEWPLIDVMVATNRPQNLSNTFDNLGRQTYSNFRVFLVAHGIDLQESAVREEAKRAGVRLEALVHVPGDVILGEVFNIGFGETEADIVAKIDDDDFYGAEYLWDLYSALDFSGAEVAGKWAHYAYLEGPDTMVYRYPKHEHRFTDVVAISTLLMRREVLEAERFPAMPWGSGSVFLRALGAQGGRVFAADRWNYLYIRGQDGERNTFPISDLKLLSISDVVCKGLNKDEVIA